MQHSQGLSNNSSIQFLLLKPSSLRTILILSFHLRLGLPRGLIPMDLLVKILKVVLTSSILDTCSNHLNFLDLIILTILGER